MPRWRHSSTSYFGGSNSYLTNSSIEVGKIGDREHRFEHRLQALVGPAALWLHHQQELVVGRLLNLDEVRHLRDFFDFSEKLPYALPTDKRLRHYVLSLNRTIGLEPAASCRPLKQGHPNPRGVSRGAWAQRQSSDSPEGRNASDRWDRRHTPYFSAQFFGDLADLPKSPEKLGGKIRRMTPVPTVAMDCGPLESRLDRLGTPKPRGIPRVGSGGSV